MQTHVSNTCRYQVGVRLNNWVIFTFQDERHSDGLTLAMSNIIHRNIQCKRLHSYDVICFRNICFYTINRIIINILDLYLEKKETEGGHIFMRHK
jgi:hypothetical protein